MHKSNFTSAIHIEFLKWNNYPLSEGDTVKPVLETTCIKRPPALKDHCSNKATLLKSN